MTADRQADGICPGCSTGFSCTVADSIGYCAGCSIPVVVFTAGPGAAPPLATTGSSLLSQTRLDPQFQEEFSGLELLGTGSCGSVYRARSRSLGTEIALKFLRSFQDPDYRRRFLQEGSILRSLRHPNLVRVHDTGVLGDIPYLVTEYISGGDLRALMNSEGALDPDRAVSLMCGVLEALFECHSHGVIHRDLKPENILLAANETTKLVDFGLAKSYANLGGMATGVGLLVGTPRYMAPEQLRMEPATVASDIYAAGLILHEMLAGCHPYPLQSVEALIRGLGNRDVARLPPLRVSARFGQAVRWALEPSPGRRPPSTRDWASALRRSCPTSAAAPVEQSNRPAPARRALALLAAVGLLLGAAGWMWNRERGEVRRQPIVALLASSPAAQPSAPVQSGPFNFWREIMSETAHLATHPKETVARLRSKSPIDLGDRPGSWLAWTRLGLWLSGSPHDTPPPQSTHASVRPMTPSEEGRARQLLGNAKRSSSLGMLEAGIRLVEQWPADGRSWLTLGFGFDTLGETKAAVAAFEVALARLGDARLDAWPAETWGALARALMTVPRHDFPGEWLSRLDRHGSVDQFKPWAGLKILGDPQSRQAVARLCKTLRAHPRVGAEATLTHGFVAGETEHSADIWRDGLKRFPQETRFAAELQEYYLARGDANQAIYYHKQLRVPQAEELKFQFHVDPDHCRPAQIDLFDEKDESIVLWHFLQYLLDTGHDPRIPQLARKLLAPDQIFSRRRQLLALRLLAEGLDAPWLTAYVEKQVLFSQDARTEQNARLWVDATGIFSRSPRDAKLEPYVARLEREPGQATLARLVRALWYSRQGRLDDSVRALGDRCLPGTEEPLASAIWVGYLEILARPLWAQARGFAVKPSVLSWVRAQPAPAIGVLPSYWKAVLDGKYDQVNQIIQPLEENDPAVDLWVLTNLWSADVRRDANALRAAETRARTWSRYWFKGSWILDGLRVAPH